MSKHLATAVRKNSPLTGRNLKQNPALGGRPSALTGWVERERKRGGGGLGLHPRAQGFLRDEKAHKTLGNVVEISSIRKRHTKT